MLPTRVGAVVGHVRIAESATVTEPEEGRFRVNGITDGGFHPSAEIAIAAAIEAVKKRALERALAAGAAEPIIANRPQGPHCRGGWPPCLRREPDYRRKRRPSSCRGGLMRDRSDWIDPSGWYETIPFADGLTLIHEPLIHPFYRCNMWHVTGRERDLLVDTGLGATSLTRALPFLRERPLICLSSHCHFDHIGSTHEFAERLVHPAEAHILADPRPEWTLAEGYIGSAEKWAGMFLEPPFLRLITQAMSFLPHPRQGSSRMAM